MGTYPYLDTVIYNNFYEMFYSVYGRTPKKTAIRYRKAQHIVDISYEQMLQEIGSLYHFFQESHKEVQHIGIISENRYEYITIYLAAAFHGVIAPIDKEISEEILAKMLEEFHISVLFYTDKTKEKVAGILKNSKVAGINIDEEYAKLLTCKCTASDFLESVKNVDSDRFSVLAFTSGTTGEVKGAMLSQHNITACVRGALQNNVLKSPTLVILPMNHTYGFNPGLLCTFYNGGTVCLTVNLKDFRRDIKEYNPYFMGIVPMVAEAMYHQVIAEAKRTGKEQLLQRMIRFSQFLLRFHIDIRHLIFGRLFCKRLKFISCGGAPLNPFYVERFMELGIFLFNGYGLTECAPLVCINREHNMDPESVGTIIKEDSVRIAEDGEIMVKGPNIMLGYYNNPEETAKCMEDGYFKTGDYGYVKERLLYVTGRKKNLIILDNGKNVSPEVIEMKLNGLPWVKESLVTLRERPKGKILVALIYAENPPENAEEDIQGINQTLPEYMQFDDYELVKEEFKKNSSKKIIR